MHVAWLSTHGLNWENFDRVKLARLKYLQLQANKYLSQFLKWSVWMFAVIDSLICEYTNTISCVKVASNFLFILSVRHVGRMNTQVWLLNSLVRLAGWVNWELVGSMHNTELMIFNSVHNNEMPSEMSCLLFLSSPLPNRRMVECSLPESQELCLEITVLARIAECLEI